MTRNYACHYLDNNQLLLVNNISETIDNAKSLAVIAVGTDLNNFPYFILNDYWSALHQLITVAENQCADLVASFYQLPNETITHQDEIQGVD